VGETLRIEGNEWETTVTENPRHEVTLKRVQVQMPATESVEVRQQIPYGGAGQTIDVYYPAAAAPPARAVILVSGLSDIGAQRLFGCRINEMQSVISWAKLFAATGVAAVTYTTGEDPAADLQALADHLAQSGHEIGIAGDRVALWACSSHVPNALGLLISEPHRVACAALCYGFMLDLDGSSGVATAQRKWRFANPAGGKSAANLPADVPLLIVRAGRDAFPEINPSIDRFVAHALSRNLPIHLVNHHAGAHGFDVDEPGATTERLVQQILTFVRGNLMVPS
jgi:hypothetical protein